MAQPYALSGSCRSGTTRSNYHSGRAYLSVGGVEINTAAAEGIRAPADAISIVDTVTHEPTTGSVRLIGMTPSEGNDVILRLGSSHNRDREFGGRIIRLHRVALTSDQDSEFSFAYDAQIIDYAWGLNQTKVS